MPIRLWDILRSQKDTFDIPDGFDPCKDKVAELEEENTSRLDDLFFQ